MEEFQKLNETFQGFWEKLNIENVENKEEKIKAIKLRLTEWKLEIETLWDIEEPIRRMEGIENVFNREEAKAIQDILMYYCYLRFFTETPVAEPH